MPMKRYRVQLSAEERQELKTLVSRGRAGAYQQTHGRILLLSDEAHAEGAMKDEEIARVLQIGRATVERVRRRCVEEGLRRPWSESGNSIVVRSGWTVKGKPT